MRRELGMLVALFVLGFGLWLSNPDFLSHYNLFNLTRQISMLGILAVGITFVIVAGGIDLSLGSFVGLTGIIIAKFLEMGQPIWMGIVVAFLVVVTIGVSQGSLITRLGLQPFIVTLGSMLMFRGVSQSIAKGGSLSLGDSVFRKLSESGPFKYGDTALVPWVLIIFLVVVAVAAFVLHFTVFGRYLYAIGGNRAAAEYSGIPVRRVETITYVIAAGLASLSGICYAAYIGQMNHGVGVAYELFAIAAVVLGGVSLRGGEGTIFGVVIGSAILKLIENGFAVFQIRYTDSEGVRRIWRPDDNWYFIVMGAVILIAVILDQVVHLLQEKRRTRQAGQTPQAAVGFPVVSGEPPK
ncbi:MAG TPA: ABC transporter permease [Tepidisphaeraceae bacterium]|nr:ABC transporter permease [Tepidisphaeraceae bacterium]